MQAVLFRQLREHYQKRDRLRLIVDYRQKFLDSLVRGGEENAKLGQRNGGMSTGRPTRMKKRAKAWARCSR